MGEIETGVRDPALDAFNMDRWLRLLVVLTGVLLVLAVIAVTVRLCEAIHHTLLLFAVGGLLAYAFNPIVEVIRRRASGRHLPRWVGVTTLFLSLFGIFGLGVWFLGSQVAAQVGYLSREHGAIEARGRDTLRRTDDWLHGRGISVDLEGYLDHPPPNVKSWGEAVAAGALTGLRRASASIFESVIVLLITLYLLIYSKEMKEGVNDRLPERLRPYVFQWQRDVNRILGGFVRGQLLLAIITGAAAAIGMLLLGVHLWLLIGLFVVVATLVPVFGAYIGAAPAVVAAALTPGHGFMTPLVRSILVAVLFVIINEAGTKVLYPRLVGKALGLHEVIVLFVLFAGLEVGGIWGVLFAAPLVALSVATAIPLYQFWQGEPPVSLAQEAQEGGQEAKERGTP